MTQKLKTCLKNSFKGSGPVAVRDSTWMSALPVHSMKCQKALVQVTLSHLHK